jgi:hypothetical protein
MDTRTNELDELMEAADDYELEVIANLRAKVGQTWDCNEGWTNLRSDVVCSRCGRARKDCDVLA